MPRTSSSPRNFQHRRRSSLVQSPDFADVETTHFCRSLASAIEACVFSIYRPSGLGFLIVPLEATSSRTMNDAQACPGSPLLLLILVRRFVARARSEEEASEKETFRRVSCSRAPRLRRWGRGNVNHYRVTLSFLQACKSVKDVPASDCNCHPKRPHFRSLGSVSRMLPYTFLILLRQGRTRTTTTRSYLHCSHGDREASKQLTLHSRCQQ